MIGDTKNYVHRGIAPRAIAHIYQEVQQRVETVFDISVSYMEIYNERIYDLLDDLTNAQQSKELTVAEDKVIGFHVRGLTQVPCKTEEEALDILFGGELSRTTAEHLLNKRSNRSHCIFTVHISQRPRMGASEKVMFSKLNLVDLAGSERLKKTMADGDEAREFFACCSALLCSALLSLSNVFFFLLPRQPHASTAAVCFFLGEGVV